VSALTKSARTYRVLVRQLPNLTTSSSVRSTAYQEAAKYLRDLYREHGRENVRRALRSPL
jgi:hypothetical protein